MAAKKKQKKKLQRAKLTARTVKIGGKTYVEPGDGPPLDLAQLHWVMTKVKDSRALVYVGLNGPYLRISHAEYVPSGIGGKPSFLIHVRQEDLPKRESDEGRMADCIVDLLKEEGWKKC
jgi:hypothetical protein